ncbi:MULTISPECIES: ROK family protein [Arthrobacter]|uniref:ROK family protein n=1 Tax=Arthrobacter terricola TaxID=2547396 RepID=A0A4R5KFW1_9MICC|nr:MULTISPECIES: ROK family protein [Arthrobacter]MBT8161944.1 ROK family protein [Arthrobacter sp. GN70]TDF94319.1 ROK family protein [Arthrobacter terricola]
MNTPANPEKLRIGVDLGGTGTRFVAINQNGDVVSRLSIATPDSFTEESAACFLYRRIRGIAEGRAIASIGIGASGPVDPEGVVRNPDTLPAFTNTPLVPELAEAFGVPVAIDNDAACGAIAERRVGAAQGSPSLLHITLGTGIGSCLLLDGKPFRGSDGMHPEGGHIAVGIKTEPCYCGRRSCWEQAASRQTLQRTAAEILVLKPTDRTALAELANRAIAGNEQARAVFNNYGTAVADGLGTLLAAYRPRNVVLGGSAADHYELFVDSLRESLERLGVWIHFVELAKTKLDDFGGAIGAAYLDSPAGQTARNIG